MVLPSNKKMSLLCIIKVLEQDSDEKHPLTQAEIISKVKNAYGIELERKSVGNTLDSLLDFGYDINKVKNKGYYLGQREFEPSEITFLIDALFSSRSIDSKHSRELAEKLSKFLSVYERKKYKYLIKSDEIIRTNNKQLFYTIDVITEAIEKGKQVEFNYNRFYFDKKKNEKSRSKRYVINPYFMINNQGRYYLVCNYDYFDKIANYKIDLISNIKILETDRKPIEKLEGCEHGLDMAKYANENIYMFHNKAIDATLKIDDEYAASYVAEWFGKNAKFYERNGNVYVDVKVNEDAIIYWCLQYGQTIELVEPASTRAKIKQAIDLMNKRYN